MELKEAKCPNCGGTLKLNPEIEKGICVYCGTEIIVADAIQKFKGEVSGIATTKASLTRAYQLLEDDNYDGAMKTFRHILETEPTNAEAYFGMFKCSVIVARYYKRLNEGQARTTPQYYSDLNDAVQKYGRRAVQYAPDSDKSAYESDVNSVANEVQAYIRSQEEAKNKKSGGCYVATAVYGSYDCPEVWTLRRFRDEFLAVTLLGRLFIYLYYAISPVIVKYFGETQWFKRFWKGKLDKMVARLQAKGVESSPYQDRNW